MVHNWQRLSIYEIYLWQIFEIYEIYLWTLSLFQPSELKVPFFLSNSVSDAFKGIFGDADRNEKLTLPVIHVYGFSKVEVPEFDFHEVRFFSLHRNGVLTNILEVAIPNNLSYKVR